MKQPFLYQRFHGPGPLTTMEIGTLLGATPTVLGGAFGSEELAGPVTRAAPHSRVVRFKGNIYSVALQNSDGKCHVFKTDGVAVPAEVLASTNTMIGGYDNSQQHIGIYNVLIAGVPTLVSAFMSNAGWILIKSTTGLAGSWTETVIIGGSQTGDAGTRISRVGVFQNKFYFILLRNTNKVCVIDPVAQNVTEVTYATAGSNGVTGVEGGDFCEFNGSLYWLAPAADANAARLMILQGTVFNAVCDLPTTITTVSNDFGHLLFAPGDNSLVAFFQETAFAGNGLCAGRVTFPGGVATPASLTTTIVPVDLRYNGYGGVYPGTGWINVMQELETDPTSVTSHLILSRNGDATQALSYYEYNGPAALIGNGGNPDESGGTSGMALPNMKLLSFESGGQYQYDATMPEVNWAGAPSIGVGGEAIRFTVTAPGGVAKSFRALLNKRGEFENPVGAITFLSCTKISGPGAVPALSGGNKQIDNCTGDGVTVYEFTWTGVAEGVGPGTRIALFPEAF